jgi:hypothetical protein
VAQFSLLYNSTGTASVLYSFILIFFSLNILFIMPVIFRKLCNLLSITAFIP